MKTNGHLTALPAGPAFDPGPLLASMLEQTVDLVAVVDADLRLRQVSQTLADAAGRVAADISGHTVAELGLFGDAAPQVHRCLAMALASGQPQGIEVRCLRHDGHAWVYQVQVMTVGGAVAGVSALVLQARDITEHRRIEDEVRRSEREFRTLAEHSPDVIIRYGLDLRAIYCNREIERHVKVRQARIVGRTPTEGAPPGMVGAPAYEQQLRRTLASGENGTVELQVPHPGGELRVHSVVITAEHNAEGEICAALAVGRDITEQVRIRQALADREREFRTLAENAGDNIIRWTPEGRVLYLNPAMARLFGRPAVNVVGCSMQELAHEGLLDAVSAAIAQVAAKGEPTMIELRLPGAWGQREQVHEVRLVPERDDNGAVCSVLGVGRDITASIAQREFIESLARTDPLTQLANRQALHERAPALFASAHRRQNVVGVMLLDVDQFKSINDGMGHSAGDQLLCEIAHRLHDCLRANDLLVRLGGDEFVILIPDIDDAQVMSIVAAKVHHALGRPFSLDLRELHISASIGVALYPNDGVGLEQLLAHADSAMYHAKRNGRARTEYYRSELGELVQRRLLVEAAMREACHGEGLEIYYQPKVCLHREGTLLGAEALLRWHHPGLGLLGPDQFIPLAEETGLIVPMGRWVLQSAAATVVRWNRGRETPLTLAVNVSTRQFVDDDLPRTVSQVLRDTGCDPGWLAIEITESALLEDSTVVRCVLDSLRSQGVRVAIDDFGTGYSALNYLARFEVDCLKIDKSFVQGIEQGERQAELVKAFIAMANALGLDLVAEGVETEAQSRFLSEQGCGVGQGYRFGRPVPLAQFEREYLATGEIAAPGDRSAT